MSAELRVRYDVVRLSAYDANGWLGLQCDAYGEGSSGLPGVEAVSPYGLASRPLDPAVDAGGQLKLGAGMLNFWEGPESFGLALHDPRLIPGLPQLEKGETAVYGAASNFTRYHADGRISAMCTTDGTDQGQSVAAEQGPNGYAWRGPWGKLTHDALGLHYLHVSGARLDIGAISGLPSPLDALSSYATLSAHIVTIGGSAVKVGSGAFEPAAKAIQTLALATAEQGSLASLQTAVTALAAAVTALCAIPANSGASGAAATATTAAAAAAAAVASSAAALTIAGTALPAATVQVA